MILAWLRLLWEVIKALPWWAWLVFGLMVGAFVYGEWKEDRGEARVQAKWDLEISRAREKARGTEEGWKAAVYNLAYGSTLARIERERSFQKTLADLRSGAVRVRPRLQCVPRPAGPSPGHDDPSTGPEIAGGVQASDIELVLHVGNDADAVSERLKMCQDYVRIIQNPRPG